MAESADPFFMFRNRIWGSKSCSFSFGKRREQMIFSDLVFRASFSFRIEITWKIYLSTAGISLLSWGKTVKNCIILNPTQRFPFLLNIKSKYFGVLKSFSDVGGRYLDLHTNGEYKGSRNIEITAIFAFGKLQTSFVFE